MAAPGEGAASFFPFARHLSVFRREFGERALGDWWQRRRDMNLNLVITVLALMLATVAGQSPLF